MSKSIKKETKSKNNKKNTIIKKKNVNKARIECKILIMIENGRKEITTKKQLEKFNIGSMISYVNKSNVFKPGGFIVKFEDEYFVYVLLDFKTKFKVKYVNVKKMLVGDVYKVTNDFVSLVKGIQTPTKYEVKVNNIIVYYGKESFDARRFKCTEKYKRMIAWNDYFNGDDE